MASGSKSEPGSTSWFPEREEPAAADTDRRIGQRISAARTSAGVSQGDFAAHCGVEVERLEAFEAGTSRPSPGELREIAQALGVSLAGLMAGDRR